MIPWRQKVELVSGSRLNQWLLGQDDRGDLWFWRKNPNDQWDIRFYWWRADLWPIWVHSRLRKKLVMLD